VLPLAAVVAVAVVAAAVVAAAAAADDVAAAASLRIQLKVCEQRASFYIQQEQKL